MPAITDDQARGNWIWLYEMTKPFILRHCWGAVIYLAAALVGLLDPLLLREVIDKGIPEKSSLIISITVGALLLSYAGRSLLGGYGESELWSSSRLVLLRIRLRLFRHINRLSVDFHEGEDTGTKLQLVADTVDELGRLSADCLPILLRSVLALLSVVGALFFIDRYLAVLACPVAPLFVLCIRYFKGPILAAAKATQQRNGETYAFLQEHLSSLAQVQLLNIEASQTRRAGRIWKRLIRAEVLSKTSEIRYAVASGLIVSVVIAGGLLLSAERVVHGTLTIGGMVAFYAYLARLFEPMYFLVEAGTRLQRIEACVIRLRGLCARRPQMRTYMDGAQSRLGSNEALVECHDLAFGYAGKPLVLSKISLKISPGASIGITGSSGSGKSTLGKLLVRLHEPVSGNVLIEGTDASLLSLHDVRSVVAYLQQDTILFQGTLLDNLKMGNAETSMADIREAVEVSQLVELEKLLPNGLLTPIGPGGKSVSGGERQRIAIARALLRKPRLLILDETTSGLDIEVEARLFQNLRRIFPKMALLVISHRLHSLGWLDRCFRLSDGALSPDPFWLATKEQRRAGSEDSTAMEQNSPKEASILQLTNA